MTLDTQKMKQDFPILKQIVNDEPLVYLDNAATTQKPKQVLACLNDYYRPVSYTHLTLPTNREV